jgi:invasion protein IalB
MMTSIRISTLFSLALWTGFLSLAALPAATGQVHAQQPKQIGTYNAWSAFTYQENGGIVCYMVSEPTKDEGDYTRRGKIYTLVTHRPAKKSLGVVSVIAGYQYKEGSEISVNIGGTTYRMFTVDDHAWAATAQEDKQLVEAMRKGATMVIKGASSRGTETTDTYSLSGFTRAYEEISKACKVAG